MSPGLAGGHRLGNWLCSGHGIGLPDPCAFAWIDDNASKVFWPGACALCLAGLQRCTVESDCRRLATCIPKEVAMLFHRNTRFALALYLALSPVAPLAAQPAVTQAASAVTIDAVAQPSVFLTTDQGLPAVRLAEPLRVVSRPVTPLAPETTATVDGSIGAGEYGSHVDGREKQTNGGRPRLARPKWR